MTDTTGQGIRRKSHAALAGLALAAGLSLAASPAGAAAPPDQVATWGASADATTATLADQTVRNIVHTSVGGENLRITLTNTFGSQPVTFDAVYVGQQQKGAAIVPSTNRRVTFDGSQSVTIPVGAEATSDPLPGDVPAQQTLAVSLQLSGAGGTVTGHRVANQVSHVSGVGDHAADETADAFTATTTNWFWIAALTLDAPRQVDTVVAFGDSITDGNGSTTSANRRWPDYLARRILAQTPTRQDGVSNQGISGNKVLADGTGTSGQVRFLHDALGQPDVDTIIVTEGINDIRWDVATEPHDLITAYRLMIRRAHDRGVCVVGGTLTPWEGGSLYSEKRNALREQVNAWIRDSGEFDAVVDFDRVTRDPQRPERFLPAYDSGDHLHPGDAGYQAMAAAVDLQRLDCHR
jgi:lysophospholipase L1-like esterase